MTSPSNTNKKKAKNLSDMLANRVLAVLLTRHNHDRYSPHSWISVAELMKELRMDIDEVINDLKMIYAVQTLETLTGNGKANHRYRFDPTVPLHPSLVRVKAHLTQSKAESVIKHGAALVDQDILLPTLAQDVGKTTASSSSPDKPATQASTPSLKRKTRPVITLGNAVKMAQLALEENIDPKNKEEGV